MCRFALALLVLTACSDSLIGISPTELVIDSPSNGSDVFSLEPVTFKATATNSAGVKLLVLRAGELELARCGPSDGDPLGCEKAFDVRDFAGQQKAGTLELRAVVTDLDDLKNTVLATINIRPLRVSFDAPKPAAEPVRVRGTSRLALSVAGELPIESARVTFDDSLPLQDFPSSPFEANVDWNAFVGPGRHTLKAEAVDAQQRKATATMEIEVTCAADGECDSGDKCCITKGTCVATGTDCPP